ncbi:MAG: type I glyceraldehyde-3-phosphate dehydrogenase [Parcubacteria group bacterium]|nr:type I glyceraldehyde-3-phosphate dehydrogenase [Parcubacteria group bacterium]
MKTRIAINGFGRIGRVFFRAAWDRPELEIVAINDLAEPDNLAYLLKYDTVYGKAPFDVSVKTDGERTLFIVHDGTEKVIPILKQKDPSLLPWRELDVDIAVEATGVFESYKKAQSHLHAGARRVVVTAPIKDDPVGLNGATILLGINEEELKVCDISSNASCTTNANGPVMAILDQTIGIEKAMLNTVHGYTASQALVDNADAKDYRRGRAAAQNIVPSTTGAASATNKALKNLTTNFDGIAMRVPVISGSIVDITFVARRKTSVEEVNEILRRAAREERWKKVFAVTDEPLVSSDIIGTTHASIVDLAFTRVVGGDLVKVLAWYDNEMGYVSSLVEHVIVSGSHIRK